MDIFQKLNIMYQVNLAKIEKQMLAYYLGEPKMIKLSNGVEVSEETVVSALKKAGISVEPKHIFKAGDVATFDTTTSWRLIVNVGGKLCSVNAYGNIQGYGQTYFEGWNYKYIGRQSDLLRG